MSDPREIEGSAERAADRGREQDLGYVATDKPSLGSPAVASGLVSEFAGQVVGVRKSFNEGKIDGDKAQQQIRDLAKEYGRIVMGADDRYQALPWNNPARLGRRVKLVVPALDGISDPGELLFVTVGSSLIDIARAHEEDRLSDDAAKGHTQTMLEDTVQLILGTR